jgi:ABC-2 type transport system permease protein
MAEAKPKHTRRRILGALIQKELREIARDGRLRGVSAAVLGLFLVTLGLGLREVAAVRAERHAAQEVADDHFRTQDDKNPHVAAHYGTYVFKPAGALSFVNPGVDAFVGVSLKLEAHKRNSLEGARARDGTALARFSRLSVASVLELLVPLLIVAMGFAAWTAERERGTLRQLGSLGVAPRSLLLGKLLALLLALAALLVPAFALGAAGVSLFAGALEAGGSGRLLALVFAYGGYITLWAFITLWASARAKSSRGSLVALLGLWVSVSLIVPRVATDVAGALADVPSGAVLSARVQGSLKDGLPGGPARDERVNEISETLLEQYGFKGAETLMDASLLNGLELQAEALFENEVFDHHFAALGTALERREQLEQALGMLSPVLVVRSLSMALAGTDAAHHRHFSDRAEAHRRGLVDLLNREFAEKGGAAGFDYKAGKETWEKAPEFSYTPPPLDWVLRQQLTSLVLLAGWLLVAVFGARRAVARLEVV